MTTYVNGVTLTDAAEFNKFDALVNSIFSGVLSTELFWDSVEKTLFIGGHIDFNRDPSGHSADLTTAFGVRHPSTIAGASIFGFSCQWTAPISGTVGNTFHAGILTSIRTPNVAATYALVQDIVVGQDNIGAASTVTLRECIDIENQGTVSTTVRAIRSKITSGTNRHNLYIDGTAVNYLEGATGIGVAASASAALVCVASTTAKSSLRLPHGSAPTSPVDGDIWTTTAGIFVRANGVTVGPLS